MNFVTEAWDWTMRQPDTVKAAVLTAVVGILALTVNSIVSVAATAVNNYVTLRKLRVELAHDQNKTERHLSHDREKTAQQLGQDRAQKEQDRKISLRRDIYLGVAAYIDDSLYAIMDLSQAHLDRQAINAAWRRNSHFAAKLHLMAEPRLLDAYIKVQMAITRAAAEVNVARESLEIMNAKMAKLQSQIRYHDEARERVVETVRARAREDKLDPAAMQRLFKMVDGETESREALAKEHDAILNNFRNAQREAILFAQRQVAPIYPLFIAVTQSAREELGEPFDAAAYATALRDQVANATAVTERLFGNPTPPSAPQQADAG